MKRENVIFGIVFGLIALLSILLIQPFISFIVLAGVLAYTLFPVYALIRRRTNRPGVSSAISIHWARSRVWIQPRSPARSRFASETSRTIA